MTKVLRASYLAPQQCVYRTLVPARSCARLEKDEATGAMMASVHDASVSHAATVSFASAANDAAGLSVCQVATARSPALLHSGSIVYSYCSSSHVG